MRKLPVILATLLLAAGLTPAGATAGVDAEAMSLVATIPFQESTHLEFMTRTDAVTGVEHTYAVIGSRSATDGGVRIIDVTDPDAPVLKAWVRCLGQHNQDPAVSPDGNTIVFTSDSNFSGSLSSSRGCLVTDNNPIQPGYNLQVWDWGLIDISDLDNPVLLGTPLGECCASGIHTAVFHPSRSIAYLANQETPDRRARLSILNLEGAAPVVTNVAMPPVGSGPHDITFNADGTRAYVSAITATYILDTTDPLAPVVLTVVVDPGIKVHHEAFLTPNGRYLAIVDEMGGAAAAPQCPGGGVHFFDVANELAPVWIGVAHADNTETNPTPPVAGAIPVCTAHEGNFSADGSLLSLGWFQAGTRVFDVSALDASRLPGQTLAPGEIDEVAHIRVGPSDVWAAKMHPNVPGYVFVSEQSRGFEVYELTL